MATNIGHASLLALDANRFPLQTATAIKMQDAPARGGSPKQPIRISPIALTTTVQELSVPVGAVYLIFKCTQIVRYGDNEYLDAASRGKGYKLGSADADIAVPCADLEFVYMRTDATTGTMDFLFEMIGR